jgi:hypothetical protein
MPKLFLVGITPDHRGLVLSEHARAKRGDMVLEIDDRLLEAIDKANRLRTQDEGHRLESAALPSKWDGTNGDGGVVRLSPREIQQRLRAGETVAALARSSGTDEAWIRRFATPVLAEQAKVVERARGVTFTKRGVGPSGATLGPAVAANVIDRGVPLTLPDIEAAWGAYQHPSGGWHVTFTFPFRGRRQTAEWEIDLTANELTARNKLAGELAWREQGKKLSLPKPAKAPAPKRVAPRPEPAAPPSAVVEVADAAPTVPAGEPAPATATEPGGSPVAVAAPGETSAPGSTSDPAPGAAEAAAPATGEAAAAGDAVQELPLTDAVSAPSGGPGRKPAPARKAPPRKAPAKRAAAAVTETPARRVVPVRPAGPSGSMPPTDLDVVDVFDELPPLDDDDVVSGSVPIVEPGPEEEIVLVDEPERPAGTEVEEDDGPTGPISLRSRPQPAPLGARPAPPGGPPAL